MNRRGDCTMHLRAFVDGMQKLRLIRSASRLIRRDGELPGGSPQEAGPTAEAGRPGVLDVRI